MNAKPRIVPYSPASPEAKPRTPERILLSAFARIFRAYRSEPTLRRRSELREDGLRAVESYFAAKVVR